MQAVKSLTPKALRPDPSITSSSFPSDGIDILDCIHKWLWSHWPSSNPSVGSLWYEIRESVKDDSSVSSCAPDICYCNFFNSHETIIPEHPYPYLPYNGCGPFAVKVKDTCSWVQSPLHIWRCSQFVSPWRYSRRCCVRNLASSER